MLSYLRTILQSALKNLQIETFPEIKFSKPKSPDHGDLATNVALVLAKPLKQDPKTIAKSIIDNLAFDPVLISRIEIAGPGFINFFYSKQNLYDEFHLILKANEKYGHLDLGKGRKTQVEFVSANPTGPLNVGHGRQAVLGDTIASLLEVTGHRVQREYYYNNAGRQMRILGESLCARYMAIIGKSFEGPKDGYQGKYLDDVAQKLVNEKGEDLTSDDMEVFKNFAETEIFQKIRESLDKLNIVFDNYFNERLLYEDGTIDLILEELRKKDLIYDKDGATWLRKIRDTNMTQDRVMVKSNGEATYRLPDICYHKTKFDRGFELIIDIFGSDHIDAYPDVIAALSALGYDTKCINVLIHQFVTLTKNGEKVKMSTRRGDFVTLDELIDEIGSDVVRYFFVMRNMNSHLNFDFDLAKKQSNDNPAYYVQYAHARICSILRHAQSEGIELDNKPDLTGLETEEEIQLIKILLNFPEIIKKATTEFEPHQLAGYLEQVSTQFHKFYHQGNINPKLRVVIKENIPITNARLALCLGTKIVLANALKILKISAPTKM